MGLFCFYIDFPGLPLDGKGNKFPSTFFSYFSLNRTPSFLFDHHTPEGLLWNEIHPLQYNTERQRHIVRLKKKYQRWIVIQLKQLWIFRKYLWADLNSNELLIWQQQEDWNTKHKISAGLGIVSCLHKLYSRVATFQTFCQKGIYFLKYSSSEMWTFSHRFQFSLISWSACILRYVERISKAWM